jgi:hypothetical protein
VLVEWNKTSAEGRFVPEGGNFDTVEASASQDRLLLSEEPIEAIWLRIRQLHSVTLAQKANAALEGLTPTKLSALGPGEAYVWSSKATDDAFTRDAIKVRCRPRVTQHGGATKTAVGGSERRRRP